MGRNDSDNWQFPEGFHRLDMQVGRNHHMCEIELTVYSRNSKTMLVLTLDEYRVMADRVSEQHLAVYTMLHRMAVAIDDLPAGYTYHSRNPNDFIIS